MTKKKKNVVRMQRCIANNIVLAQVASDGGKNVETIADIFGEYSRDVWEEGYSVKQFYIKAAIKDIQKSQKMGHPQMFHYSVRDGGRSKIVYFTFYLCGVRRQVSFHTFGLDVPLSGNRQKVRWDKESSREAVIDLAAQFWEISPELKA